MPSEQRDRDLEEQGKTGGNSSQSTRPPPGEIDSVAPHTLPPTGDLDLRKEKERRIPLSGLYDRNPRAVHAIVALRHFDAVIAPESKLLEDWDDFSRREQRMFRAGVLKELFDLTYRELEALLNQWGDVAAEARFGPGDVVSYSVFSRAIGEFDEEVLETVAKWANNAALHWGIPSDRQFDRLPPNPPKPRFYHEIVDGGVKIGTKEKMREATKIIPQYMALVAPYLEFGRDQSAPNFR